MSAALSAESSSSYVVTSKKTESYLSLMDQNNVIQAYFL